MNYIVYDLEFNQHYNHNLNNCGDEEKDDKINYNIVDDIYFPFEIIQIGAIKLNKNLEEIDRFDELIKPSVHAIIHPYIEKLTNITTESLNCCDNFERVYNKFINFIGDEPTVLCVWGQVDITELIRNIDFFKLNKDSLPDKYIDVQLLASKYFNNTNKNRIGLKNATELLEIESQDDFHNALNDAFYTAEVYKKLLNKNRNTNAKPLKIQKA